jgi:hypothetical protein
MSALPSFTDEEVRSARRTIRQRYRKPGIYTVGPDEATTLLASSKGNRGINDNRVAQYAEQMKKGAFALNGEAAIIDTDYALRDGHHRLIAITKSGVEIQMAVVPGIPSKTANGLDIQHTMDDGQNRTTTQVFGIENVPNRGVASTVVKAILNNGDDGFKSSSPRISSSDMLTFYYENESYVQELTRYTMRMRNMARVPTASIGAFLHQASVHVPRDTVSEFVDDFTDGAAGMAIGAGRTRLIRLEGGGEAGIRDEAYRLLRFTFDAWRRGLRKVETSTEKPLPEWK